MNMNLMYHQSSIILQEELKIIERAKTDPYYFTPLYKKYYNSIFRYVYKRVDEEDAAYDITSNVFVKALGAIHKFEFRGVPFSSWLFRIAKSELYQSFRDKKITNTVNIENVKQLSSVEEINEDFTEEDRRKLLITLSALKENQIQLIEMRYFEKRSFKEIGELTGMTENNAKVKTFRALIKLRQKYKLR